MLQQCVEHSLRDTEMRLTDKLLLTIEQVDEVKESTKVSFGQVKRDAE